MKGSFSKVINVLFLLGVLGFVGYQFYKQPKFDDGEQVPGFEAQLIDGSSFSLDQKKGEYILLDFWGSWCGPCRMENPSLVKLYNKFSNKRFEDSKGFDIVSVAIETREASWRKAIKSDGLIWPNHIVQTDRFSGVIAKQYGVKEIPTKYLLDTNGKVLMVNPSFQELDKFLESKLQS